MRQAPLLVLLLLTGCAAPTPTPAGVGIAPADAPLSFGPIVDLAHAGPIAWEPAIRVTPGDRVYVTAFVGHFWRSSDGGATFEAPSSTRCDPPLPVCAAPIERPAGPTSGSDGAIAVDAIGTIHWAGLGNALAGPPSIPYQSSTDEGTTWTDPIDLANGDDADRQWMAIAADGTIHVIWRDSGPRTVTALRQGIEGPDRLMHTSRGLDGAWTPAQEILSSSPIPGPLVAAPDGGLYLPVALDGVQVLRSLDGGATWDLQRVAPANAQFIFPWLAADAQGVLYVAWASDEDAVVPQKSAMVPRVFLSTSHDHGATWAAPTQVSPEGHAALMPTLAAGAAGRVALAWYEAETALPSEHARQSWRVAVATSLDGGATFERALATPDPIHVGAICTSGATCIDSERSQGDFFEIAIRPNGLPIVAFVRDLATPTAGGATHGIAVARAESGDPLGWASRS